MLLNQMEQSNNGLDSRAPNTAYENQGIEPPVGTGFNTSSDGDDYGTIGLQKEAQVTIYMPQQETPVNKVQIKPTTFVVSDDPEQKIMLDHASALIRKRNMRPFPSNKTLSKESLQSNQGSQKTLIVQGQTPRSVPIQTPPKTQDRQQSHVFEKIDEILQNSFQGERKTKRSFAGQVQNNSFSSDLASHMLQESTELDKIGSIHYQDYLHDVQSHREVKTEKKPLFAQRHSSVQPNLTNKKSLLVNEHQKLKHDLTIEEIKMNPHGSIQKLLKPYFQNNFTAEGVQDLETQMKKRILPHSYETFKKQKRSISPSEIKRQAGGIAVRTILNQPEPIVTDPIDESVKQRLKNAQVGRVVNAKSQVRVPQDLILMKIASRQIELQKQQFIADRKKSIADSQMLSSIGQQRRASLQSDKLSSMNAELNQQSSQLEPQTAKNSIKLINQRSNFSETTGVTQDWHITDLLKQSTVKPANSLQVTLDYYKRSVKTEKELNVDREIMIKNYRLRAVDAKKEISDNDRKLMLLNKGTKIYVSNSLIKPEIYRFSTKVTDVLAEVFLKEPRDQIFEIQQYDQPITPSALDRSQIASQPVTIKPSTRAPITANTNRTVNSRGVSSNVTHEPEQAQAVVLANKIVDQWFDAGVSPLSKEHELQQLQQYREVNSDSQRYILANKQYAALTLKQIQQRMTEPKVVSLMLKPRVIPTEDLTAVTQLASRPYLNLMRSIISPEVRKYVSEFRQKTTKYVDPSTLLKSNQDAIVQVLDYYTQLNAVQFIRQEFTHLDQHLIQDINLSQDLFFEQHCVDDLVKRLAKGEKVKAQTEFMFVESGQYELKLVDVIVTGYNEPFRVFNLENKKLNVTTTRSRFNMQIDSDPADWIQVNRETIDYWRELSQQYLRVHKVINNELLSRYSTHTLEEPSRKNILNRVGSLAGYWRVSVEKIIIQVEALYVYAMMKSTLSSQKNDPFIKNMLINFNIHLDSEALTIEKQPLKLKGENLHPGILAFRFQAIKNELNKSSLQMSNGKYMQLPKLLYSITYDSIFKHKDTMFLTPIPTFTLQQCVKKYKMMTDAQINKIVNTYPLDHTVWIEAQKVIQEQFQTRMRNTWAESIAEQIWGFIKHDFEFDTQRCFQENQIDPNLLSIFHKIKQYQSTILYTVFEAGLRSYINFLLSFALRDQDIKKSTIINRIRKADQIRLIFEDPNQITVEGTDINDLDLIPLQLTPFIKLHAEIQISGKMRNRKYKVITEPDLDTIHKNLLTVVKNLHESTRQLKRVDAIVFPQLELENPYIQQPDIKTNSKMVFILKLIDKLIDSCMFGTRKKVQQFQQYLSIFDKKVDGIILELKKQSYAFANEDSSDADREEIKDQIITEEAPEGRGSPELDTKLNQNSSEGSSESDEDQGGFQGNNMAYKSVEIDEGLMRGELESIKRHRFMVMAEIPNSSDSGLLIIDFMPFKQAVIDHCLLLEEELNNYLCNQFAEKMKSVQSEINALKGRLDDNVSSIDDVIALLDYIDGLKRQDNKVEEIADFLEVMTRQADYIDSVGVMLPDDMKYKFYHMLNWPRTFDVWLIKRKQELIETKGQLIQQMNNECKQVVKQGAQIQLKLTGFLTQGLEYLDEKARQKRTKMLETLFDNLQPGKQKGPVPIEIPQNTIFKWLANETNWVKCKFDPGLVYQVANSLEELKQQFDELDKQTFQLNKRQLMLQIDKTDFREQRRIIDDLKPIHSLWQLAQSFRINIVDWFEEPLDSLDAHSMEQQLEEWIIEIKRLQKQQVIVKNDKQLELLNFIMDSISYVQQYTQLIKTTRVKGLNARHWRSINAELKLVIDPYTITLIRMIGLGLHQEASIKAIKSVSDIAQKEYAIQILTEQLDRDMKLEMFLLQSSRNKDCKVVKNFDSLVVQFNEFMLRVSVLKMNPYMRNFFDKLLEIEKTAKQVQELIQEFQMLQNKWVFLSNLFNGAVSETLGSELKAWANVDKFYKFNTKQLNENGQVVALVLREGLLQQLRKMNLEIDNVRDGVTRFLEAKRQAFPRLYFISNEELLQIYTQQSEIIKKMIDGDQQPFINTIYQGLIQLKFDERSQIVGVEGKDGEYLELIKPCKTATQLEKWLASLEQSIQTSLKNQILYAYMSMDKDVPQIPEDAKTLRLFKQKDAFRVRKVNQNVLKEWIKGWPGQATYLCQQIWFHQKILVVFQGAVERAKNVQQLKRELKIQKRTHHSDEESDCSDIYKSVNEDSSADEAVEVHDVNASVKSSIAPMEIPKESVSEQPESALSEYVVKTKSRMSVVDRAMRTYDRFCVNDVQHPTTVLHEIKSGVLQKIKGMIHLLNTPLKKYTYNSIVALITGCVYQRDQLQEMINQKQFKITDFEWEIQLKYILDRLPTVFRQVTINDYEQGNYHSKLEIAEIEVRLEVFNFTRYYGYQYLANTERLVITPLTLKAQRSMLVAMNYLYSCAVEGPFGTGKTETVKDLATQLGRSNYTINTSTNLEYNDILRFLKGVASSGAWVLFDEFNRLEASMLKYITSIMSQMQNAIRGQVKLIYIDEQKITIDFETGIFISINPGYAGRVDLPLNLKSFFRPIQMVVPDLSLISEILLARAGFSQSYEIAKKLTHVQVLSNELMQQNQIVKKDFGLRAIRAIIEIAEILKRQSQNLLNSEMPDIINEKILNKVNYKDQQLIQEVIEELVSTDQSKQVYFSKSLNSKKTVSQQEQSESSSRSSQSSQHQVHNAFSGTMFQKAFESELTRDERQVETIYQQIGIEGQDPTVEELEECLIVKAIRDYNNSKFADQDKEYINRIVVDVFTHELHKISNVNVFDVKLNFRSRLVSMASDYTHLKDLIKQTVKEQHLELNKHLETKCYQLYEVLSVKTGCIVIGETQAAKSTVIRVLQEALNNASLNELKLRVAEIRKQRLIANIFCCPQLNQILPSDVIKRLQPQIQRAKEMSNGGLGQMDDGDGTFRNLADATIKNATNGTDGKNTNSTSFLGKTRRNKLTDKQKATLLMDLYKATKLDRFEIFKLEQDLVQRGVAVKRLNPKSINITDLIGEVIFKSGLWIEGILTKALREFQKNRTSLKKWIHIDGPMDHSWAENLNSLLDDNKKISLPHGDTIGIHPDTSLIFETDSLQNVTPASVSRCGLVHLSRSNLNNPKLILNQYLNRLPKNLQDNAKEIESQLNTLMPLCFAIFNREKAVGNIMLCSIDEYQLMQSFIKIFDSFISSYWIDFINGNKSDWEDTPQQLMLQDCLSAHGYPTPKKDLVALVQTDSVKLDPEQLEATFKAMKVAGIPQENEDLRFACNDILSSESRQENSLKYLALWIEAFVITGLAMTFGPILSKQAKQDLSQSISGKYKLYKTDYTSYQKLKKKQQMQKEDAAKKMQRALMKQLIGTQRDMNSTNKSNVSSPSPRKSAQRQDSNQLVNPFIQTTQNLLTQTLSAVSETIVGFTQELEEPQNEDAKPMFISDFPFDNEFGLNLFDYYFNLDNSTWTKFDNQKHLMRMQMQFMSDVQNQQSVLNLTVSSVDQIKQLYAMECLMLAYKPILVVGGAASGKSTLVKDMLCNKANLFTQKILTNHISCSSRINNITLQERIGINLKVHAQKLVKKQTKVLLADDSERSEPKIDLKKNDDALVQIFDEQMQQEAEVATLKPHGDNVCLLVYIEDVHLTQFDRFQDNSSCETIKDIIANKQWFSSKKKVLRDISNVNIVGCINPNASQLPQRLLRHFSVLSIESLEADDCFNIVNKMLELQSPNWHSTMQNNFHLVSEAIYDLYKRVYDQLKPTPIKVQYTFNQREIFKMVAAICQVEGHYIKNLENVSKVFFHEALRQFGDRILMLHDYKWFIRTAKAVCCKYFHNKQMENFDWNKIDDDDEMFKEFPVKTPDSIWFSVLNHEVEGQYLESSEPRKIKDIIDRQIDRYNQQPDIHKLNLVLYEEMFRDLFKIMRALNLHASHLIIVGLKGYAISFLIQLAAFITQKAYSTLELRPDFKDEDWKQDLRSKIIETGQSNKQVCFVLDEYRMTNPEWYSDIESLITSNSASSVLQDTDLPTILSAMRLQAARMAREKQSGIQGNTNVDGVEALAKVGENQADQKLSITLLIKENIKILYRHPNEFNELYQTLMQRIKKNLHFVLTFTPSGQDFREKMKSHKQLMQNSQLIWVQPLTVNDLTQMGEQLFINKMQLELKQQQAQDPHRDTRLDEHFLKLQQNQNTIILQALVHVYLTTMHFAKLYKENHQHVLYFTPVFFMRSINQYKRLLVERRRNVKETHEKYNKGLNTIKVQLNNIQAYQKELEAKTPILQKQQDKVLAIIVDMQAQVDLYTEKRKNAQDEHKVISNATSEAKKLRDEAQYNLDCIIPALNSSLAQMQKISKYEIAEIRSMQHPPKLVKQIMKAICILLDVEPQVKTKNGKQKLSYWRASISSSVLADPNLSEVLEKFDRKRLTAEKMKLLEDLMADPDYTIEGVRKCNAAVEGFFKWIKSLRDYYYIFTELQPRRDALVETERLYQIQVEIQNQMKEQIDEHEKTIKYLSGILNDKIQIINKLKEDINDLIMRRKRASALIRGLQAEKQKWEVCCRVLDDSERSVSGDVVLAAAIINYGGGFAFSYRRQLIETWQNQSLRPLGLQTTPNFQIQELFGDNFKIREWHANGLGKDILSTDNALIVQKTKQYITCIDPQHQATYWLKNQYEKQGMIVTKISEPNFQRTLEVAIDLGKLVMVENIPEKTDIYIESLVKQKILKFQDTRMIKFCRKQLKLDQGFGLFLVTWLPKPHLDVNLTNYSTVINFFITQEGLSQSILSLVVANERKDIQTEYNNAMEFTFNSVTDLKEIERQLMLKLDSETPVQLLQDEKCIEILKQSAKTSEKIAIHLRKIQQSQESLDKAQQIYTPIAFRAATLFYSIQELSKINPMYRYGLTWFIAQFNIMLDKANLLVKPQQVTIDNEDFALKDPKLSPEYRVDLILNQFTQEITRKVIFSVFQQDRQFVTYYLALRIMHAEQLTDDNLLSFAMAGAKKVTPPQKLFTAVNTLQWLTNVMWSDVQYLQSLQPFTEQTLAVHILDNQTEWDEVYNSESIQFDKLPNRDLIDLEYYQAVDIRDAMQNVAFKMKLQMNEQQDDHQETAVVGKAMLLESKIYTEAEILEDEDIWLVSEGDEEYDRKARNVDFYANFDNITQEEKVMARYMTEAAPGAVRAQQDFHILHQMTKKERSQYLLRQAMLKRTIELVIAKVIRPDLLQTCLHQLVSCIYNFQYINFNDDVLSKLIDFDGTLQLRRQLTQRTITKIDPPKRLNAENNIQLLIEDAYADSKPHMPVMLLISHSVNVQNELQTFFSTLHQGTKFVQFLCSKGNEATFTQQFKTSMVNGDWIVVSNLQMEPYWAELLLSNLKTVSADTNPKFRLWISIPQMEDCDDQLLKVCIKIALQQPINIKMKIERHLIGIKDGTFKRGQETGTFHKNLFLGLCYLHGVLDGRRAYGPFGWHVAYEFDKNDFDISDQIVQSYLKKDIEDQLDTLEVVKHILTNINFNGKISRAEDYRILQAHIDDLFNEHLTFSEEAAADLDHSHFGFPDKDSNILQVMMQQLPTQDNYRIFGFNYNIYKYNQSKVSNGIISNLKTLNDQVLKEQGYNQVHADLENQLNRFALERQVKGDNRLINLFVLLQKHLQKSSLDQMLVEDYDRYDERIDRKMLPIRDENDRIVAQIVKQIKIEVQALILPLPTTNSKLTVVYCLSQEIKAYVYLRDTILATLDQFLIQIRGEGVLIGETEQLWLSIQNNRLPQAWQDASYDTAITSLSHYLSDLISRTSYLNQLITQQFIAQSYLISTLYDPRKFVVAQLMDYSREHKLALQNLQIVYKVTQYMDFERAQNAISQSTLLYGLWIEGADWDVETQMLIEQRDYKIHSRFPVLEMTYKQIQTNEQQKEFNDYPQLTKEERHQQAKLKKQKLKKVQPAKKIVKNVDGTPQTIQTGLNSPQQSPPVSSHSVTANKEIKVYIYKCPVFATTNRLSLGGVGQENKALFYVDLQSHEQPKKWVKRSVALLLEPTVLE